MRKKSLFFSVTAILAIIMLPTSIWAAEFNPNYIISDGESLDYDAMTFGEIQKFLEEKGGTLGTYSAPNKEGVPMMAAEIIYQTANTWRISPKFLMVLIQRESSLITDPHPTSGQYDWATGYFCFDGQPCNEKYRGFFKQVNSAGAQFADYFETPRGMFAGKTYRIDNSSITPQTQATANLYYYTPHIHGNQNFYTIWQDWFGGFELYPEGAIVQVKNNPEIWLITGGARQEIKSKSLLFSRYNTKDVALINEENLEKYPEQAPLIYPQYALIQDEQKNIYLLVDNTKRKFESMDIFNKIGFNVEEIVDGTTAELIAYRDGNPINAYSVDPMGKFIKDKDDNKIYYLENGNKYPVIDEQIIKINCGEAQTISTLEHSVVKKYMTRGALKLKDGKLVKTKNSPKVYVISEGRRRPIDSGETFTGLGYNWKNILAVSEEVLALHQEGNVLTFTPEKTK